MPRRKNQPKLVASKRWQDSSKIIVPSIPPQLLYQLYSAASLTNFFRSSFVPRSPTSFSLSSDGVPGGPGINVNAGAPDEIKGGGSGGPPNPISLPLPFPPDLIWRYSNPFQPDPQPTPSSLETHVKSSLPGGLPGDPRCWAREDVFQFLNYCEQEFDLEKIDLDKFQMNGKALCFLSKNDLGERCSGAGDVIHNILQMLLKEASMCFAPSSPITTHPPGLMNLTSPFSPHPWPLLNSSANETFPNLSHLISQTDSVTLSPAPSPKQDIPNLQPLYLPSHLQIPQNGTSTGPASSHSDSEDSLNDPQRSPSIPGDPVSQASPRSPSTVASSSSREADQEAPSTNGRLLWDFLQQLLNDAGQRYTSYIIWKNKETGVFKIVDPNGLARLWGIQKNHLSMNYDKMSRALRYYYRVNILRKVQGERHCYQFLRNPSELKSIKNISLLRQQMEAKAAAQQSEAQQAAQQAVFSSCRSSSIKGRLHQMSSIPSPEPQGTQGLHSPQQQDLRDEPHDLSVSGREREDDHERAKYYSQLMERYNIERSSPGAEDREMSEERKEQRNHFDYRNLIPQVSIKIE